MKKLDSQGMKVLKSIHIIMVMLWTVGVITMAILFLMNVESGDELYAKYKAIRFIDDLIVIPSAIICAITGIVYGIWTNWGFFKYKWITVKWIVSFAVIIVGTFLLSPMLDKNLEFADSVRDNALFDAAFLNRQQIVFVMGICSSVILILLVVISVFKPWKKKKKES